MHFIAKPVFHYFSIKCTRTGKNIGKFIFLLNKQSEKKAIDYLWICLCVQKDIQIHDQASIWKGMGY